MAPLQPGFAALRSWSYTSCTAVQRVVTDAVLLGPLGPTALFALTR